MDTRLGVGTVGGERAACRFGCMGADCYSARNARMPLLINQSKLF